MYFYSIWWDCLDTQYIFFPLASLPYHISYHILLLTLPNCHLFLCLILLILSCSYFYLSPCHLRNSISYWHTIHTMYSHHSYLLILTPWWHCTIQMLHPRYLVHFGSFHLLCQISYWHTIYTTYLYHSYLTTISLPKAQQLSFPDSSFPDCSSPDCSDSLSALQAQLNVTSAPPTISMPWSQPVHFEVHLHHFHWAVGHNLNTKPASGLGLAALKGQSAHFVGPETMFVYAKASCATHVQIPLHWSMEWDLWLEYFDGRIQSLPAPSWTVQMHGEWHPLSMAHVRWIPSYLPCGTHMEIKTLLWLLDDALTMVLMPSILCVCNISGIVHTCYMKEVSLQMSVQGLYLHDAGPAGVCPFYDWTHT